MKVNLLEPSYVIRLFHTRYFDARKLNSIFIFCGIHCVDFLPNKYNQIVVSMKYNIVLNLELFKAKEIQMYGSGGNVINVQFFF